MSAASAAADAAVQARIAEEVRSHAVVLYMKGTPDRPLCGFSAAVSGALRYYGVRFHAVDVLADPAIREGIKIFSDWPTVPQLYVGGNFVGGCDIVREMHENGELEALLAPYRAAPASASEPVPAS
ncbi:MAG TPA: Grx4 family monothiol glutaredoxin [Stellaceae bacterium]|jgi:monothiol glutaredoxin